MAAGTAAAVTALAKCDDGLQDKAQDKALEIVENDQDQSESSLRWLGPRRWE